MCQEMTPENSTIEADLLTLHLSVHSSVTWPSKLVEGVHADYNTSILRAGLDTIESNDQKLEQARQQLIQQEQTARRQVEQQLLEQQRRNQALEAQLKEDKESLIESYERRVAEARQKENRLDEELRVLREGIDAERQRIMEDGRRMSCELLEQHRQQLITQQSLLEAETTRSKHLSDQLQQANESALQAYERGRKDAVEESKLISIGKEGEAFVESELRTFFPCYQIDDVSSKKGQTDRLFHYGDKFKFRVEIKNTTLLTPEQVSDFRANINKTRPDGGLFVFLRDTVCDKRGYFEVETRPVPLVFIYGVRQNPQLLKSAIDCLGAAATLLRAEAEQRQGAEEQLNAIHRNVQSILDGNVQQCIRKMRQSISTLANQQEILEKAILQDIANAVGITPKLTPKGVKAAVAKRTITASEKENLPVPKKTKIQATITTYHRKK
jgi:hypothetical protein